MLCGMAPLPQNSSTMVFCHLETLRSSLSPSLHLTQLAASTEQGELFRPIVPPELTKYLDSYKLGGDLLLNLNMTREGDGDSFLFRRRFEVVTPQALRLECVSEEKALRDFLDFLETCGDNIILVCVDEDTVSVLLGKLKSLDRRRVKSLVSGFTWWRRCLKYLSVQGYRDIELESYHQKTFPTCPPPSLYTALVVASMLNTSLTGLADKLLGSSIGLPAVPAQYRATARVRQVGRTGMEEEREVLEIYTSFRPETTTFITVVKLDQVDIGSDSEDENTSRPLKQDQLTRQDQEVLIISSDSDFESHSSYHEEGPIEYKSLTTILSRYGEKTAASSIALQCQDCGLPLPAQRTEVFFCQPCLKRQLLSDEAESDNDPLEDDVEFIDHSLESVLNVDMDVEYLGFSVSDKESNNSGDISEKNCVSTDGKPKRFWEFTYKDKAFWVSCPVKICVKNTTMKVNNVERHIRKIHNNIEPEQALADIGCKGCGAASVSPAEVAQHIRCNWQGPLPEIVEYVKKKKPTTQKEKQNYQKEQKTVQKERKKLQKEKQITQIIVQTTHQEKQTVQKERKTIQKEKQATQIEVQTTRQGKQILETEKQTIQKENYAILRENQVNDAILRHNQVNDAILRHNQVNDAILRQSQTVQKEKQSMQTTPCWLKSSTSGKLLCPYRSCKDFLHPNMMENHLAEHHPNFLTLWLSLACPEVHCVKELAATQVAGHLAGHTKMVQDSQLAIHSMKTGRGKYWVLIPNSAYFLNCPKCPETLSLADVHNHMDTVHQSKEERFCCKCNIKVAVVDVRDHFKHHITGGTVQEATVQPKKRFFGWMTNPYLQKEVMIKKRKTD